MRNRLFSRGFTIVELLVVIVVIGILATLVVVAYNGVSGRAKEASRQSDETQAKKQIEAFYAVNGFYPTANNCPTTGTTDICLKTSPGNTLVYTYLSSTAYNLSVTISSSTGPTVYAATLGGISISTDSGATFTNKTTANGLGNNEVKGVYVQ